MKGNDGMKDKKTGMQRCESEEKLRNRENEWH